MTTSSKAWLHKVSDINHSYNTELQVSASHSTNLQYTALLVMKTNILFFRAVLDRKWQIHLDG